MNSRINWRQGIRDASKPERAGLVTLTLKV
jgi:hypothetical protein